MSQISRSTLKVAVDRFTIWIIAPSPWKLDKSSACVFTDFGLSAPLAEAEDHRSEYHSEEAPLSRLREDVDYECSRYSPPGHDPILEKALGGRYPDDPFDLDSNYPWYRHNRTTGRAYYDDIDHIRDSSATYRRYPESSSLRSSYYRSSKW